MGTQFSMVTHWNTVSMASPMLSKEVIPAHAHKLDLRWGLVTSASKRSIRRFVITEKGLLLVESGYYRFHI